MLTFSFFSALLSVGVTAITIPITKRAAPHSTAVRITPSNNVSGDDPFGFQSADGFAYTGIIYVSGQQFTVQLDTGSSDLWLDTLHTPLTNLTDTGVEGSIIYVDGTGAVGHINIGPVQWGEFTVPQQAFINAPGSNATGGGSFNGLLGVGPPSLSTVDQTLRSAKSPFNGSSFLDNVFALYPSEPNFISFLLSRNDLGISDGGVFTIGDVDQNHTDITNQPQLPVVAPQLWATFMDGVIVNDQYIFGGSLGSPAVPHVPVNQTIVVLDTGTSLSTAPPAYVDAMYGNILGAEFDRSGSYLVPCDAKINISMVFGTNTYPMHPIDLTVPVSVGEDGNVICQGAFSYAPDNSGVDFILGDSFLRNVYSLYDFGSWATVGNTPPFMQILSTTNTEEAYAEFDVLNQARLQQAISAYGPSATPATTAVADTSAAANTVIPASRVAATAAPLYTPTPSSSLTSDTDSVNPQDLSVAGHLADTDDTADQLDNLKRFNYIILGLLAIVVILLIAVVVMVAMVLKGAKGKVGKGYKALHDPTSVPQIHGGYTDAPHSEHKPYAGYSTPYADGGH